jgi:hypothetical protein
LTFKSTHHPGTAPLSLVLLRAQAEPVALALVGVFAVALVGVLRGADVLGTLLWAVPLAYALAVAWTTYELHRRPAEIVLHEGFGLVRSVWDVAASREARVRVDRFLPVFRPFRKDGEYHASIGDTVLTLHAAEWPALDDLLDALRASADALPAAAPA